MFRFTFKLGLVLGLAATMLSASMSAAEPIDLATVFPEDTLLYIARSGSEQTAEAIKSTAFGRILADPQIEKLLDGVAAAIDDFIKQKIATEAQAQAYAAAKRTLARLWKYPSSLAVLDAGIGKQGPYVQAALICRAGRDADELEGDLATLAEVAGLPAGPETTISGKTFHQVPAPLPGGLYYGTLSGYFVLGVGEGTIEALASRIGGTANSSLAKSDNLVQARRSIGGPAEGRNFTIYLDAARALARARDVAEKILGQDSDLRQQYERFASAAQLDRLQAVCYESYYHKDGILSGLMIQQAPAEGESAAQAPAPITEGDLAIIPKTASWALAANVDLSHVAQAFQANFATAGDDARAAVMKWIKDFEADIGFCLDTGLMQLIGDTVIVYDAPEAGGLWFTGTIAMLESPNAEQLQTNLRKLVKGIAKRVGKAYLNVKTVDYHGHTIAFANVIGIPMPLAPTWARHDNWVIVGLYPQSVMAALDRLSMSGLRETSILTREDFIAARKVLGPLGSKVSYIDAKAGAETLYPFMLLVAQTAAAAAQGAGVHVDISMLPSREAFTRHLFGDVTITRNDEHGVLQLSYGPLPVNPVGTTSIASTSLAISILLPALSRARELAKRTVCASNLRGIGQAMYIHAQEDDRFPDDFQTMIKEMNATPKQFKCPSTDATEGDLTACYKYIAGQKTTDDRRNVVLYEKRGNHGDEGGNVLFVDGHVEFVKPYSRVEELVKETRGRLAETKADRKKPKARKKSKE